MQKYRIIHVVLICICILYSCKTEPSKSKLTQNSELKGITPPIQLKNGSTEIIIPDLFKGHPSIVKVISDSSLSPHYDEESDKIIITINQELSTQLANLKIQTLLGSYDLLLVAPLEKRVAFMLQDQRYNSVWLEGNFNGWATYEMHITHGGQWVTTLDLKPDKYEYYFLVDGVKKLDHSEQADSLAEFSYLDLNPQINSSNPNISNFQHSDNNWSVRITNSDVEFVYWNNLLIDHEKIDEQVSFQLPNQCFRDSSSSIRVYGSNRNSGSQALRIPLRFGQPIL